MSCRLTALVAAALIPAVAASQGGAPAIHGLGPTIASIPTTFLTAPTAVPSARFSVIPLSDGRLIVSDVYRRVVLMFDSTLQTSTVVLDSMPGRGNSFTSGSMLFPFRGDSTLFFDRTPAVLVVIDPSGKLVRTFPPPGIRQSIIPNSAPAIPAFTGAIPPISSPILGLLYRLSAPPPTRPARPGMIRDTIRYEDSTYLIRMDYDRRTSDSLTKLSGGGGGYVLVDAEGRNVGSGSGTTYGPLLPFYDDAVVTADGSVAILRAREYRLDRIDRTGTLIAGKRLTYPWRRISDDERQRLIDSVNGRRKATFDSTLAKRLADSVSGKPPMTRMMSIDDGVQVERLVPAGPPRPPYFMYPEQIPDFRPPVGRNAMMADADNNVWIAPLPATPDPDGMVWEVYDRETRLIDRIRIPVGRTIVAFAKGGIAFVAYRDAGLTKIDKVRITP